jgi:hypothetical protein
VRRLAAAAALALGMMSLAPVAASAGQAATVSQTWACGTAFEAYEVAEAWYHLGGIDPANALIHRYGCVVMRPGRTLTYDDRDAEEGESPMRVWDGTEVRWVDPQDALGLDWVKGTVNLADPTALAPTRRGE